MIKEDTSVNQALSEEISLRLIQALILLLIWLDTKIEKWKMDWPFPMIEYYYVFITG